MDKYIVKTYCQDCQDFEDPKGCFDGGHESKTFNDLQGAREYAKKQANNCVPWYAIVYMPRETERFD